ncbi:GGDEF domain-containing protein [Paractinoplanes globisporus]|uniref:Diguanylate cyclase domain-containing protein n=1 Tax=Paractinoplanes globisporus TaxID=113565 RepID=A0ABW6WPU8_9ACTN|nr:GGDEF domain-containing protein [Actinoplanes globisporus]
MRRLPRPEGSLNRTRLVAVAIGGLAMLTEFPQLGNVLRSPEYSRLAAACILATFLILIGTFVRGRSGWLTLIPVPVLVAIGGAGLFDPVATTALALASTIVLSLYGSTALWVARVVGGMIAIPVAVAISPMSGDRPMAWNSPTIIGVLPQVLLMAVLTRGIYVALLRQERAAARDALLARAGLAMMGVVDSDEVRIIGRRTAEEVVALSPGIALVVLRRRPEGFVVTTAIGAPPGVQGRLLGDVVTGDREFLDSLVPGFRVWELDSLGADPAVADAFIAVGGRRRIPAEVLDSLRNLSHQVVLAEKVCLAHAELEHRAHHDHLTQLAGRAKFVGAVDRALDLAGDGRTAVAALLNVDLDDFKRVNDCHGHAAGDELLIQVAARMTTVTTGRGLAARLGGDEFAVLLPDLADPLEAERIAEQLCDALAAPFMLTAATVTIGASIGVAVAEPGLTVTELSRRADMAMYAAKAAGKNRIESFAPAAQPVAT